MFLAFTISDIIRVPFGYLLDYLNRFTHNYGVALILFAVLVKLILYPISAKSKKSTMKMSRLTPMVQAIQTKYANDQAKQAQAVQELYKAEGVKMSGGCLWSLLPLLLIFPLYQVVRQPIVYMLHENAENAAKIVACIKEAAPTLFGRNSYYDQMVAVKYIPEFAQAIRGAVEGVKETTLAGLNFNFLGIDLGLVPTFNVFGSSWSWDWAHIGGFLLPVLSAGSQVLSMLVSQKMNNSVVTDENGVQDKEAAKNSQQNQSMKTMLYMMPIMSLWIGFTVPGALSLYWLVQGLVSTLQDVQLTLRYRKIYDAEDAERLKRALAEEAAEAERERVRAERRAANPDGITENTSKKKMQQKKQQAEADSRAAAAKEYAARRGAESAESEDGAEPSGDARRPYARGRAYDPNRYSDKTTED